jgi:hypothetical protein
MRSGPTPAIGSELPLRHAAHSRSKNGVASLAYVAEKKVIARSPKRDEAISAGHILAEIASLRSQ